MNLKHFYEHERMAMEAYEAHYRAFFAEVEEREKERERRLQQYEEIIRQMEEEMKSQNGRLRSLRNT